MKMASVLITIVLITLLARRWEEAWKGLRTANIIICMVVVWNVVQVIG